MNKRYIVKQNGIKDCACACLLSIIRYNNANVSRNELEYLIKTNENGTNAYDMVEGMKTIGFNGFGLKKDFNELITSLNIFPCIAHIKVEYGYHYVVIYNINHKKKYFEIMDPAYGYIKISFSEFQKKYLNTILIFKKVKEIPNLNNKNELFDFIKGVILKHKNKIILLSFLSLMITILSLITSYNMKINVDYIIAFKKYDLINYVLFLFILILLLKNTLIFFRDSLFKNIEFDINNKINYKLVNHIFKIPYKYFYSRPTGEIVTRLNDLEYLKNFISTLILNVFIDIFVLILSVITLLIINVKLFLITLIFIVFYMIIAFIYKGIYKKSILNVQIDNASYQTDLIENINSFESINNLNKVNEFINNLDYKYYKSSKSVKNFKNTFNKESFLKNTILDLNVALITNIGLMLVVNTNLTLGDLISFTSVLSLFIVPFKNILDSLVEYVYSLNAYGRINDFLLIKTNDIKESKEMIDGNIKFDNLNYLPSKENIQKLNYTINKKDKVFISGRSGSGKSTILKILKKYIMDYKGNIYINDINLKDIERSIINNSILYVSQNEKLFTKSIKENILLNRKVSMKKYNKVNNITLVNKIIDSKLFRDKEIIEEGGFNISGGEKQKIILSRSLHNRFNYLILDEALSEVDEEDEKTIIKNLLLEYKDKTIIYVSHKSAMKDLFEKEIILED